MRVNAYILTADPAYIEASILSYYDIVNRIVVSYDENSIGWTGVPLRVTECLERLKAIDRDGKMHYSPGHYARLDRKPMENETYQRQCSLDEAGADAEWVLQLDTDEVLADLITFQSCLAEADNKGFKALDYPARWLFKQIGPGRFLECCSRNWSLAASYPGSVAVQPGVEMKMGRQVDEAPFRVDFRSRNTDPFRPRESPVHRVIRPDQGIYHYSWVRDEDEMIAKSRFSGHARDFNWDPKIRHWIWSGRHPFLAMLSAPLRRRHYTHQLRIARITPPESVKQYIEQ